MGSPASHGLNSAVLYTEGRINRILGYHHLKGIAGTEGCTLAQGYTHVTDANLENLTRGGMVWVPTPPETGTAMEM